MMAEGFKRWGLVLAGVFALYLLASWNRSAGLLLAVVLALGMASEYIRKRGTL